MSHKAASSNLCHSQHDPRYAIGEPRIFWHVYHRKRQTGTIFRAKKQMPLKEFCQQTILLENILQLEIDILVFVSFRSPIQWIVSHFQVVSWKVSGWVAKVVVLIPQQTFAIRNNKRRYKEKRKAESELMVDCSFISYSAAVFKQGPFLFSQSFLYLFFFFSTLLLRLALSCS